MFQLVRLIVFLAIGVVAIYWVAGQFSISPDTFSFASGIGAAAIAGFLEIRIARWWSTVSEPYRPQMVKLPTKETPSQITFAAMKARLVAAFVVAGPITWFYHRAFEDALQAGLVFALVSLIVFIAPMFAAARSAR